jgi:hypothetical protein
MGKFLLVGGLLLALAVELAMDAGEAAAKLYLLKRLFLS